MNATVNLVPGAFCHIGTEMKSFDEKFRRKVSSPSQYDKRPCGRGCRPTPVLSYFCDNNFATKTNALPLRPLLGQSKGNFF